MVSPKSSELAAALAEIAARGLERVALVVPFALDPADLEALAAAPAVAWVGQAGAAPAGLEAGPELVEDDGTSVPEGTRHILFVGSWRALPPPLARAARRLEVATLLCRVGTRWRHPPTPGHLAKAVYYKAVWRVLGPPARLLGRLLRRAFGPPVVRWQAASERRRQALGRLVRRALRELESETGPPGSHSFRRVPRLLGKAVRYGAGHAWHAFDKYRPSPAVRVRRKALRLGGGAAPGLVLAPTFPLRWEEIPTLLALPGIAGLVLKGGPPLGDGQDPRLGAWLGTAWILPAGARRVYIVGGWGTLGRRALVQAVEQRLEGLFLPFGPFWLPVPLRAVRRLLELRPFLPNPWLTRRLFRRALADADQNGEFVPGRIILVCGSLAPGGAERQVANTLVGLARHGLQDVQLLCDYLARDQPQHYDFYLPLLRRARVPAREITLRLGRVEPDSPGLPAAFRRAAAHMPANLAVDIANLYLEFQRLRPEIVHAFLDWSSVRAGMAAALAGVPRIVLSGRNVNPSHFALYQRYMDPVYQALGERPEVGFVNNSAAGARDYEAWLGLARGRIGVLRNGVDFGGTARAAPERIGTIRAALGVPDGAMLVGGAFRLFPEKRPMLWVDAAAEIARRHPAARFVIYGQGVLEDELRRHIRSRGLEDRLVLAGVTSDVLAALSALDVFMLTSFKEGTPNVVLEAQWVGTPVVAVEAGGTREALDEGRTGWIVDPPTATALAARVSSLLADPALRAACRSAGPAFVEARFGVDRMIAATLAAYGFEGWAAAERQAGTA